MKRRCSQEDKMVTILVADDDIHILQLIKLYLQNEGYSIKQALNGREALVILESEKIDLAVIDIMMPEVDGWELCEEIRKYYEIPVLMVTAKGEPEDKIKGFRLGTDDYVVKPFEPIEIVMRVNALLRRYRLQSSQVLQVGELKLDDKTKMAYLKDQPITLPLKEFEILFKLASYPEQIFTRNQLIEQFWGIDYEGDDRTVDVHIKRIREKFRGFTEAFTIKTIRGLGYRLEVTNE